MCRRSVGIVNRLRDGSCHRFNVGGIPTWRTYIGVLAYLGGGQELF